MRTLTKITSILFLLGTFLIPSSKEYLAEDQTSMEIVASEGDDEKVMNEPGENKTL